MNRPRIQDPHAVPVVARDSHLPPVPAEQLQPAALKRRFEQPPVWQPEFTGDGLLNASRAPAAASVLVPLLVHEGQLHVLLTRRTEHLRDHAGQISFPGGRAEIHDAHAADTALREAEEEIGLDRAQVQVLGQLPIYTTVTNFQVTPVVAWLQGPLDLQALSLDSGEVAEAFQVPLAFLMNPANHQRHRYEHEGLVRHFLSMPWRDPAQPADAPDYFIWGATAAMLRNLYRFLAAP